MCRNQTISNSWNNTPLLKYTRLKYSVFVNIPYHLDLFVSYSPSSAKKTIKKGPEKIPRLFWFLTDRRVTAATGRDRVFVLLSFFLPVAPSLPRIVSQAPLVWSWNLAFGIWHLATGGKIRRSTFAPSFTSFKAKSPCNYPKPLPLDLKLLCHHLSNGVAL